MSVQDATWWAAFGAVAQAIGSLATFAAVAVSLWVVLSERAMRAKGSAGLHLTFAGDGTPGVYVVGIEVLNAGFRPFHVSSVGWRTGWLPKGPANLAHRFAIQNLSVAMNPRSWPCTVEPGHKEGFYTRVSDFQSANAHRSRTEMFRRRVPLLGPAPIHAMVNITGRKPLLLKVSGDLAEFLRTGEHAATTDG